MSKPFVSKLQVIAYHLENYTISHLKNRVNNIILNMQLQKQTEQQLTFIKCIKWKQCSFVYQDSNIKSASRNQPATSKAYLKNILMITALNLIK